MEFLDEIIVYSAVFGPIDKIMSAPKFSGIRFILFTDNQNLDIQGWEVVLINDTSGDPRKCAKKYKILPHQYFPRHRWSVWIDGTHMLRINPNKLIKKAQSGILLFRHPKRDCVYDEAKVCKSLGFDHEVINNQMQRYADKGFLTASGLSQCTVLVREHSRSDLCKMMNNWWYEINAGSIRDQLSFDFVAWQAKIIPDYIEGDPYWNQFFYYTPHGKKPHRLISYVESYRSSKSKIIIYIFVVKDNLAKLLTLHNK